MPVIKPIKTAADHKAALKEVERLWGAKPGTANGDRLDVLATLVEAYEDKHFPIDLPNRAEATDALLDQSLFVLDSDQYDAFVRVLDNPPAPGPKLRALLRRRKHNT